MATNRANGGVTGASVKKVVKLKILKLCNADGTYTLPQAAVSSVDICVIAGGGGAMGQSGGGFCRRNSSNNWCPCFRTSRYNGWSWWPRWFY